jgi:hypothetical protein
MAALQPLSKSLAAYAVTTEELAPGEASGKGTGITTRTVHPPDTEETRKAVNPTWTNRSSASVLY